MPGLAPACAHASADLHAPIAQHTAAPQEPGRGEPAAQSLQFPACCLAPTGRCGWKRSWPSSTPPRSLPASWPRARAGAATPARAGGRGAGEAPAGQQGHLTAPAPAGLPRAQEAPALIVGPPAPAPPPACQMHADEAADGPSGAARPHRRASTALRPGGDAALVARFLSNMAQTAMMRTCSVCQVRGGQGGAGRPEGRCQAG